MSEPTMEINSLTWWDDYFEHHWEKNNGRSQTAEFMQALISNLPQQEAHWIKNQAHTILDWGCALGDGLPLLNNYFKPSNMVGIDFSQVSILKAREKFPDFYFYKSWEEYTSHHALPDVVFNSNCLEHFKDFLSYLKQGLNHTKSLYIILVPYKEKEPICESHCQIFDEFSFPIHYENFTMLHQQTIAMNPHYWDGQQLLIIYGSKTYCGNRKECD